MIGKFKKIREQQEEAESKKNTTDVITAERRMKIDIQKYNENKIDNVIISFPNEGSVTEIHITIFPN